VRFLLDRVMQGAQLDAWLNVLLDVSMKGAIVLGLAWVSSIALRRSSAAARHLVWSLALAGLLALPILTSVLPGWQAPIVPRLLQVSSAERRTGASIKEETSLSNPVVKPDAAKPAFSSARLSAIVLAIWLTGVFVALAAAGNA
jgi:hypothetical protein